jgi:hypothetical protein
MVMAEGQILLPPWLLGVVTLAATGVLLRRRRRLAVGALAFLLLVFAADSAIHSVHHLTDPRGAADCRVLSVAQHLQGNTAGPTAVLHAPSATGPLVTAQAESFRGDVPLRLELGRAPPSFA